MKTKGVSSFHVMEVMGVDEVNQLVEKVMWFRSQCRSFRISYLTMINAPSPSRALFKWCNRTFHVFHVKTKASPIRTYNEA